MVDSRLDPIYETLPTEAMTPQEIRDALERKVQRLNEGENPPVISPNVLGSLSCFPPFS